MIPKPVPNPFDAALATGASAPSAESSSRALESWEMDFNEIEVGKLLGRGGFGEVFKGIWRGTEVAVKKLLNQRMTDEALQEFRSEVQMLRSLRHPNIVLFMGVCTVPPNFAIVTEFCARGTLFDVLQDRNVMLEWTQVNKIALQISLGMNYLHMNKPAIIHRDLKSANVLVDDSFNCKIGDFGLSRMRSQAMTGQTGTYQYMAPEVLTCQQYTEKADVYSFGILLWETCSRQPPFLGLQPMQVAMGVYQKNLRPPIPERCPPTYVSLMQSCWDANPSRRPSFIEVINVLRSVGSGGTLL